MADGRYSFKVVAANVNGGLFDGNGDFVAGDDYVLASAVAPNSPTNIFRYFGDADGDGDVDNSDFAAFRTALGNGPSIFDSDGDGDTDLGDFVGFRNRFGTTI